MVTREQYSHRRSSTLDSVTRIDGGDKGTGQHVLFLAKKLRHNTTIKRSMTYGRQV